MTDTQNGGVLRRFREGRWDEIPAWKLNLIAPLFTLFFAVREFFRDRAQNLSSSLAYTTALSLVPLLSVVTSVLAIFGAFDTSNENLVLYLEPVFPAAAAKAAHYLQEFARTSATSVGGVSAVAFLVISIFLFMDIERTFNAVWHAPNTRSVFSKLLTFYFVVTFGPVLVTTSVGLTARAQLVLSRFGLEMGFLGTVAPFLIAFFLFTTMNWSLPSTRVRWSAAIVGGLFTALAFEAAKYGFNFYVTQVILESYNTIYGALGLFPIFLVWIYVSWIVVLLGAELAYTVQNLRTIVEVDAAQLRTPAKQKTNIYNPLVGLEVLAPVARHFKAGHGSVPENELIRMLGYNEGFLREVVAELERIGAVKSLEDGESNERMVMPAKQLDDISLIRVAESFFDFSEPNSTPMAQLQTEIKRATGDVLRGKTALALISDKSPFEEARARAWVSQPQASAPMPTAEVRNTSDEPVSNTPAISEPASKVRTDLQVLPPAHESSDAVAVSPDLLLSVADMPPLASQAEQEQEPTHAGPSVDASFDEGDIDLGDDWDDFDVSEAYDDVLSKPLPDEMRATAEIELSEEDLLRNASDDSL
ncbi:MAG: YhjD/YihY/BrkB family envelope integrity protein [bacterium]